ncbi:MAG: AAA family ATPase [Candidatus Aegiribacteria sp.]|nr:AAA family ATPase [Candidatus Aegiribacteria sp.]
MGIRIDRISINRGGPLKDDFTLEPAGLNLIYGRNETGKTYIVEAMIDFLFRTGKNTPWILKRTKSQEPTIRKWKPGGKIVVSGLEDTTTTFTSGGNKLEDCRSSGSCLPEELSRLMVVRAGDTRLSSTGDGVGDNILRTYLSGKGVLDEVENGIKQETVKKAIIENGTIDAKHTGLVEDRLKVNKERNELKALQFEVDESASLCAVNALKRSKDEIAQQLSGLEDAKKHRAFMLNKELRKLELDMNDLPPEQDLMRLVTDISLYRDKFKNLSDIEEELRNSADEEDNYIWVNKAREGYLSHVEAPGNRSLIDKVSLVLLFLFILLTAVAGFFSRSLIIAAAAGAVVCLIIRIRKKPEPVSASAEMQRKKLEQEFSRRFHRELTDIATLQVEHQNMETRHIHSENLKGNRIELKRDIETKEASILSRLHVITGEEVPDNQWDARIDSIRRKRKEIQEAVNSLKVDLSSLNVHEDSYLPDPSSEEWDKRRYLKLKDELEDVTKDLEREKHSIDTLKMEISVATENKTRDIRELLTALEDRIETVENTYKDLTARILAENTVFRAVCEFRSRENERLDEAMGSDEVVSSLLKITGHYTGLKLDSDGYLNLSTSEGEEYPLSQLSTGASEQVYIALRTGFAELTMGEVAFLIFDDAFQHSDWERRKNLVNRVIGLVNSGWQVFYFTMDDHLKKLFDESGKDLGRAVYKSVSLNGDGGN